MDAQFYRRVGAHAFLHLNGRLRETCGPCKSVKAKEENAGRERPNARRTCSLRKNFRGKQSVKAGLDQAAAAAAVRAPRLEAS